MEPRTIRTAVADGVATLTLARPDRRNAISIEMREEISATLASWRDDPAIGAVILTGAGQAFSAGFDLDEFGQPERFDALYASSARYHRDVWSFPKPIVAAVNGPAMGGGFDLACLCDVRLASSRATFGHPEIKFGAPPLFTPLHWIVGDGVARDLCLTGRRIDAAEAHRVRLVSEVVEPDALAARALAVARSIVEAPAHALRFTKAYLTNPGATFEESFRVEHDRAFEELILPDRRKPPAP
jgi:enoyl-CoA hydratase/carnithine racemase